MTKPVTTEEDRTTGNRPPRPLAPWEIDADESYAAWLRAERQLKHQRHLLPLERRRS